MGHRPSLITACLALVALAAILGHVCVLPGHSHAAAAAHHHDQPADGHGGGRDGTHIASCDALRSPSAAQASPLLVATVAIGSFEAPASPVTSPRYEVPVPTSSPPLYLAHRTLLI